MNILMLQTDIEWQAPLPNRAHIRQLLDEADAGRADVAVLPEMFATGFCVRAEEAAAEEADVLEWMRQTARRYDAAIAGSAAVVVGGSYYNRFYFVKPDGRYAAYDKRHLFAPGGEVERFTAGRERVVVEWRGWRILLQVCYDLRFPVFSRNRGDYDMILYTASWPQSRIDVWSTLLKARAIENACYVAGVNRVGRDPSGDYNGMSALRDFKGRTVAAAKSDKEEAVFGTADMQALREFRAKFPVLNDADDFGLRI